ncbi:hypothetical protein PWY87_25665 [Kribbella solani]|uniref:hypothetical protein n=1 Tax=Kribbella solani TaxID=236067 RepID=UPI0029B479F3|nr:hypothetical protein [Kribbella solani]MDX3005089.1 hypothetical protein [Kribbella solani]
METDAPIAITINPEARVNVTRTTAPIPTLTPNEWHPIPITLTNEGFVTGPLSITTDPVPGLDLDLPTPTITGAPRQDLAIHARLHSPTTVDISLTFRALNALGGLATHSQIHLLLRAA